MQFSFKRILPQIIVLLFVLLIFGFLSFNAQVNMENRGMEFGFKFLERESSFDIQFSLIEYSRTSSYFRAYLVGLINTILVAATGIVFATIIGVIVGISRLSKNLLVRKFAGFYVELFRNLPLLLQIFFWYYAALRLLPLPQDTTGIFGSFYLTIKGLYSPSLIWENLSTFIYVFIFSIITIIALRFYARKIQEEEGKQIPVIPISISILIIFPLLTFIFGDVEVNIIYPKLKELSASSYFFEGGLEIPPEFIALILALVGDVKLVLEKLISVFKQKHPNFENSNKQKVAAWWSQIENWRKKNSLGYINSKEVIKPQFAVQRLYELTKAQDVFITTEVGQHQMWAAQHYKFDKPNRWMTSGGLGTMGYGLPAAVGVQIAHPGKLVIDIAGEASVLMTMQEMSTAVQYKLPIKIFILNNEYMGMVRQWQELLHEKNYSESYTAALPDFVKLAEAYGCIGIRANKPDELDGKIEQMLSVNKPVIFDCVVDKEENCYPMIPSGKPHNQMLLGKQDEEDKISEEGKVLV